MLVTTMTDAEYRKHPGMSKSKLDWINRSPQHYQHYMQHPPEATPAMTLGRAIHASILEPSEYGKSFAFAPKCDRRTTGGKAEWARFEEDNKGKEILSNDDMLTVTGVAGAFHRHDLTAGLLSDTFKEASLLWTEPTTGIACKSRLDILQKGGGAVYDVKTTDNAGYGAFKYSIRQYRYHVQAAYYLDAVKYGLGIDSGLTFCFIAIEKRPPYGLAVYVLDDASIEAGRQEYQANLRTYANCIETKTWPGYTSQVVDISIFKEPMQ